MKTTLLVLNCSGRVSRSVTRRLTHHFTTAWSDRHPESEILHRDLGGRPMRRSEMCRLVFGKTSSGRSDLGSTARHPELRYR